MTCSISYFCLAFVFLSSYPIKSQSEKEGKEKSRSWKKSNEGNPKYKRKEWDSDLVAITWNSTVERSSGFIT